MPYRIQDYDDAMHLHLEGKELEELFVSALEGTMELLSPDMIVRDVVSKQTFELEAQNETELLIQFIQELVEMSRAHDEVYTNITFNDFSDTFLSVELEGGPADEFGDIIETISHHEKEVEQNGSGKYEAVLVFNVV
ncbi:MAG: hypothetical protein HOJ15_04475 [Candidatus Jacksonbacteria bacterium]|jgi:SHS2 domain-containing protein|nr:hypothetical protein [Candidatus Jacksonbacteria bacterium]MBT6301655.1 hypothetical protein [Candidatus Jacksonbacteria bacterium]MBT6757456.1 hypothetical protein [Candidatus Jacksonbacteria bacterium]MBT6955206.1 hypothetical protein [Candidatus Jacksonbacteria bacterium]MBT7008031.1 hypothetical protein [Candidatus Jacksonbacteria bacterium]